MKRCFAGLMLAAMVLAAVPASAAPGDDEFFKLAGRRNWLSFADARPVSPYFGIPGELRPTVPFARSYIDASPGRSECFAALFYPDEVVEEGVLQTTGKYNNPTEVRTNNPDVGNGTKKDAAPLGMPGPHASTNNPSRTDCSSEAVSGVGPGDGQVLVDAGFAKTHAVFDGDKVVTDEAVSRVEGVTAGPIRIANLETRLKLEYILDGEPVISYAMTIAGLEANGAPVAAAGGQGIVLAGQNVAKRDLIDQFNDQVAKAGATFKDQFTDHLQLVAPTMEKDKDGGVHVTGPAVEAGVVNKGRQGQGGDHFGVRLGYASVYAILNSLEALLPDLGELSGGTTPGSPVESTPGGGDSSLTPPSGLDTASPSAAGNAGALGASADLGARSSSASAGLGSSGYGGGTGDTSAAVGADQSALPAAGSPLPGLGSVTAPRSRGLASAQLAAAESRRAARNTANGLLGGILVLGGALVWVGGMALLGKARA